MALSPRCSLVKSTGDQGDKRKQNAEDAEERRRQRSLSAPEAVAPRYARVSPLGLATNHPCRLCGTLRALRCLFCFPSPRSNPGRWLSLARGTPARHEPPNSNSQFLNASVHGRGVKVEPASPFGNDFTPLVGTVFVWELGIGSWELSQRRSPCPFTIFISSASVHGRVRSAVCARTFATTVGSTAVPCWPHSRRT